MVPSLSSLSSIGNLFTYKESYSYNKECTAYVDCTLLRSIAGLSVGTIIPEALLNFHTCKIKLNINNFVYTVPYTFAWIDGDVITTSVDADDSDFDKDEDEEDSSDSSDNSDDSDNNESSDDDDGGI